MATAHHMKRILRRPAVERMTGYKKTELYELMNEGRFPRPVPLGKRAVGWLEHEIQEWIDARIKERDVRQGQREAV